jgi:hypothetical protein
MELWFLQQLEIMEILTVYEIVIIASALVGTYVKMNIEINKVKSRIFVLEQNHSEITTMLRKLDKDLTEIKILLARKQLDT